jgi:hypothetical protein
MRLYTSSICCFIYNEGTWSIQVQSLMRNNVLIKHRKQQETHVLWDTWTHQKFLFL